MFNFFETPDIWWFLLTGSTKQHLLSAHQENSYPISHGTEDIVTRKIKGVQRSRHKDISKKQFIRCCVQKLKSDSVPNFRISRDHYRLFLTKTSKVSLSRFTVKRILLEKHRRKTSHFTMPLNWRDFFE